MPRAVLLRALDEEAFEQDGVLGVATEDGIGEVAEEGDEADEEVDDEVEPHFLGDVAGKAVVYFLAGADYHCCHEGIEEVADTILTVSRVLRGLCQLEIRTQGLGR